jgi:hypothetical protein
MLLLCYVQIQSDVSVHLFEFISFRCPKPMSLFIKKILTNPISLSCWSFFLHRKCEVTLFSESRVPNQEIYSFNVYKFSIQCQYQYQCTPSTSLSSAHRCSTDQSKCACCTLAKNKFMELTSPNCFSAGK